MKKIIFSILVIFSTLTSPLTTFAEDTNTSTFTVPYTPKPDLLIGPELINTNDNGEEDVQRGDQVLINETIPKIAVKAVGWLGAIALIMFIIVAVKYFTSYAQEDTHTKAKEQMIYIIAGIMIALLAFTIVSIVINLDFTT